MDQFFHCEIFKRGCVLEHKSELPESYSGGLGTSPSIIVDLKDLPDLPLIDLHRFQTRFVINWENNRDGEITVPLSLKTIGSAGYRDYYSN